MKKILVTLFIGLMAINYSSSANACNSACYAQKKAVKARALEAKRKQARMNHARALAAQKARSAQIRKQAWQRAQARKRLAAQQRARLAQKPRRVQPRKQVQRRATIKRPARKVTRLQPRKRIQARPVVKQRMPVRRLPAKKRVVAKRNNKALTPQEQLALLLVLQQRANTFNVITNAYQNNMNNISHQMRLQSATRSCQISGSCRVEVRRNYNVR